MSETMDKAPLRLPRVKFRAVVPIGGAISGAGAGLGILVLLQQFGVVYPSLGALVGAVAAGALAVIAFANVARKVAVSGLNQRLARAEAQLDGRGHPAAPVVGEAATATWSPTHRTQADGAVAYDQPDATTEPAAQLDPWLEVEVVETWGDWSLARCSNGWSAWVDGRVLEEVPR